MKTKSLRLVHHLGLAALAVATFLAPVRAAPVVTLDPVAQNIGIGDTALVNLNITGLGLGATAPKLGSWLANIMFNNSIVTIGNANVTFGTNLDLGVLGTLQGVDTATPGLVKLDEISFEDPGSLIAQQPGAFLLATLSFTGIAPGTTTLTFAQLDLGDEDGFPLATTSSTASITVGGAVGVPDGLSPLLGATCLILLCGIHARWRRAAA